jgi:hypothetical protein
MRAWNLCLTTCLLLVCAGSAAAEGSEKLQQLSWVLGSWQRTGLPEGRIGYETWHVDGATFAGVGVSKRENQLLFEERLGLLEQDGNIYYVADVAGNPQPIRFKLVSSSNNQAVFTNPEHDFPKRIVYSLQGDQLEVSTSGDGKEIVFHFRKFAATVD